MRELSLTDLARKRLFSAVDKRMSFQLVLGPKHLPTLALSTLEALGVISIHGCFMTAWTILRSI
jgi:hypothetical protein